MSGEAGAPTRIGGAPGTAIATGAVLLVSDDCETGNVWAFALRRMGLEVTLVASEAEALEQQGQGVFDLILIDVCGPGLDGIELARQLRSEAVNPLLLFTSKGDEAYLVAAYRAGVDDCVVKPVSPPILLAKVRAWLRRAWTVKTAALDSLWVGSLCLAPGARAVVRADGSTARLTNLEFRVLHLLMSQPGVVLPTEVIVERVWGYGGEEAKLVKNVIYRLRRKVEQDPSQPYHIQTGPEGGYVFTP